MVYGDKHPHLVAVLVPDQPWLDGWAKERGKAGDLAVLAGDPALHASLAEAVERVNARLSAIEKVRRFIVAAQPFSIDNNQLTPTLKPRRHKIREIYGAALEGLYRAG